MKRKMLPIWVIMVSALLSVGLVNPAFACDFDVYKFNDFDGDGVWDLGEPAIEGWEIRIYIKTWEGWVLEATGVTDANGLVQFGPLMGDQTWRVWEAQAECWDPTTEVLGPWAGGYYEELFAPSGTYREFRFGNVEACDEGEGCTPGFWRNHFDDWAPTGYSPDDDFDTTFGGYPFDLFDPNITLGEAIWLGGGGANKVARHGTAALLSAAHPDVDYPFTVGEIIEAVRAGDVGDLVDANELNSPGFCD